MEYQWQSEDYTISWCQDVTDGQWKEYIESVFNKEYEFHHLVSKGKVLILQDRNNKCPVILEEKTAYFEGDKFATGEFAVNELSGTEIFDKWEGCNVSNFDIEFCKNENSHCYELKKGPLRSESYHLVRTFSQSLLVEGSESVVILYNNNETAVVLTDTCAYCYNTNGETVELQGKWIKSCYWSGETVMKDQPRTDFIKKSPIEWKRRLFAGPKPEIASYTHILDIEPVSSLLVMKPTDDTPFAIVDDQHIYQEGTIIANGSWEKPTWNGTSRGSGAGMSVTKHRNGYCEYRNGEHATPVKRKYVEVTQPGRTAIMHINNELCIIDKDYASIDGNKYAVGGWKLTRDYTGEDSSLSIQFTAVAIGKVAEKREKEKIMTETSKRLEKDARSAIKRLKLLHVLKKVPQRLIKEGMVRIDMQKIIDTDRVPLHNIQVQINTKPRIKGKCTTIAHVNVPSTVTRCHMSVVRDALEKSLDKRISYELQQIDYI